MRSRSPRTVPVLAGLLALALASATLPAGDAAAQRLGFPRFADGVDLRDAPAPGDGEEARPAPRHPAPLPDAPTARRYQSGHADGHIVVRFAPGLDGDTAGAVATALGAPEAEAARYGDFHRVRVPAGDTAESLVARFRRHPSVTYAGVDPLVWLDQTRAVFAEQAVNDPLFDLQWHHQRLGTREALERNPADGRGVIVAVIDSGVGYGSGTAFPARRIPDMGATRFAPGRDFVDGDAQPFDEGTAFDPDEPETSPRLGHGSFAASVIAATVNNASFGAGLAPEVTILPVRIFSPEGFTTFSFIAEAIRFSTEAGARVINMSFGGPVPPENLDRPVRQAIADAYARGVVLVTSSSNSADEPDVFEEDFDSNVGWPGTLPQVISVGSVAFDGQRADYSNFGRNLELSAPAGEDSGRVVNERGMRDAVLATSFVHFPLTGETLYGSLWATGTSFAAPQVSAAAALLLSLGVDDPEDVRTMLRLTARDAGPPGFDTTYGHGVLDLAALHRGLGFTQ